MRHLATSAFDHSFNAAPPRPSILASESRKIPAEDHPADQAAIRHLAAHGGSLCTLVHVDGSYSRRIGAQLSVAPDGSTAGDLADHCLERELVHRVSMMERGAAPECLIYGKGSPFIDFRLPCGSTICLLVDPAPDRIAARRIVSMLDARRPAALEIPIVTDGQHSHRKYLPSMRILTFGEGPEAEAMRRFATAYGAEVEVRPAATSDEQLSQLKCDAWTGIVCLSHDHDWERAILPWALGSHAFYVGAIGGANARASRLAMLEELGVSKQETARLIAPVGLFPSARHPAALALSTFAEIAAAYEGLVDG